MKLPDEMSSSTDNYEEREGERERKIKRVIERGLEKKKKEKKKKKRKDTKVGLFFFFSRRDCFGEGNREQNKL